jgi:release factor glutamine methyltransferase
MIESAATCEKLLTDAVVTIGGESPRLDAELLLSEVTGWTRTSFRAWPERQPEADEVARFHALVARRAQGEPVAHLLGTQEFWSLPFQVNASTLIPRPDTECLVEAALNLPLPENSKVLDLGTGTGAIALALASERPGWKIDACDASAPAVELALNNARALGFPVTVTRSDWFSGLPRTHYNLIVSNPPYVAEQDAHLSQGDVRFEPLSALVAGPDGLDDIRHLVARAPSWLEQGGWLLIEHGYDQGEAVRRLFLDAGFSAVDTGRDFGQRDRFTMGCRAEPGVAE